MFMGFSSSIVIYGSIAIQFNRSCQKSSPFHPNSPVSLSSSKSTCSMAAQLDHGSIAHCFIQQDNWQGHQKDDQYCSHTLSYYFYVKKLPKAFMQLNGQDILIGPPISQGLTTHSRRFSPVPPCFHPSKLLYIKAKPAQNTQDRTRSASYSPVPSQ